MIHGVLPVGTRAQYILHFEQSFGAIEWPRTRYYICRISLVLFIVTNRNASIVLDKHIETTVSIASRLLRQYFQSANRLVKPLYENQDPKNLILHEEPDDWVALDLLVHHKAKDAHHGSTAVVELNGTLAKLGLLGEGVPAEVESAVAEISGELSLSGD